MIHAFPDSPPDASSDAQSDACSRAPPRGAPISNDDAREGRVGLLHAESAATVGSVFASNIPGDWLAGPCITIVGHDAIAAATGEARDALSSEEGWALVIGSRFGRAVLNADDPTHVRERRLWAGAFASAELERCFRSLCALIASRVDCWAAQPEFDIYRATRELAFTAIATTLGGFDDDAGLERMRTLIMSVLDPTPEGETDLIRHQRTLPARAALESMLRDHVAAVAGMLKPSPGLLSHLRRVEPFITEQQLVQHLNLMLIAGSETSASLMAFLLLYASIPRWREWLSDEAHACMAAGDLSLLENAPRLDAFVREAGRLNPALICAPRVSTRDVVIAGVRIPARSKVMLSYAGTNLMESAYEDALSFRPERWIDAGLRRPVTFGSGHRTCIGMRFAGIEVKVLLAHVIANYEIARTGQGAYVNSGFFSARPAGRLGLSLKKGRVVGAAKSVTV